MAASITPWRPPTRSTWPTPTATCSFFRSTDLLALPKDCLLNGDEVQIIKNGNEIILREIPVNLGEAFNLLKSLSEDFFAEGRIDELPQNRDF